MPAHHCGSLQSPSYLHQKHLGRMNPPGYRLATLEDRKKMRKRWAHLLCPLSSFASSLCSWAVVVLARKPPLLVICTTGGLVARLRSGSGKKTPSIHDSSDRGVGGRQRRVVIARKHPLLAFWATRGLVDGGWWMYATTVLLMSWLLVQCHTLWCHSKKLLTSFPAERFGAVWTLVRSVLDQTMDSVVLFRLGVQSDVIGHSELNTWAICHVS